MNRISHEQEPTTNIPEKKVKRESKATYRRRRIGAGVVAAVALFGGVKAAEYADDAFHFVADPVIERLDQRTDRYQPDLDRLENGELEVNAVNPDIGESTTEFIQNYSIERKEILTLATMMEDDMESFRELQSPAQAELNKPRYILIYEQTDEGIKVHYAGIASSEEAYIESLMAEQSQFDTANEQE